MHAHVLYFSMSRDTHRKVDHQERFESYVELLTEAAGHADRAAPLRDYCTGLLLPGERKSVEPMAARTAPDRVRKQHQSMHHFVADAPWNDEEMMSTVRGYALPVLQESGDELVWVVDDTGSRKRGKHMVGVARQYCGEIGKQDNCQVAVSLSLANASGSLPIAHRLHLPEKWAEDPERRRKTKVPEHIKFQKKWEISRDQIKAALETGIPRRPVVADAGYGNCVEFRDAVTDTWTCRTS